MNREQRTWRVVREAFLEREPIRRRRSVVKPVLALAAVAAVAAIAVTPPGRAVVTTVREAIGLADADRALYSLPGGGRILAGGWLVHADGSTRHIGDFEMSSWSPFGRYVVGAGRDRIVALEPGGAVRWRIARPGASFPRWTGTPTDTRIAYLSGGRLRVVAGDGTGDRAIGPAPPAAVAPAWGPGFTLAYADVRGRVWTLDAETGKVLARTAPGPRPRKLLWRDDRLLVVRTGDAALVGDRVARLSSHALRLGGRTLFRTTGTLGQVVPSPDGRWLLVTWPEADQWLFVRVRDGRVRAIGNIAEQLDGAFRVDGWTS